MAESYMHPEDFQKGSDATLPNYHKRNRAVYVGKVQVNTLDAFISELIIEDGPYGASVEAIKAWKFKLMHFNPSTAPAINNARTSSELAASDTAASGTTNAQRKQAAAGDAAASGTTNAQRKQAAASDAAASGTTNAQRKRPLTSME